MNILQQTRLVLRRGRERTYIAEIVEVQRDDPKRYLVNYRYGWTGSDLTEGTRTQDPVDLETAERLFASLLDSRKAQGYEDAAEDAPWRAEQAVGPSATAADASDPRAVRLLYLLERVGAMSDEAASRLIWRIGQVRLAEAVPLLSELRHSAGPITSRGLAYALYRCGAHRPSDILPALEAMQYDDDPVIAEQARIAVCALAPPEDVSDTLRADLPEAVLDALAEPADMAAERLTGRFLRTADQAHARSSRRSKGSSAGAEDHRLLVDLFLLSRVDADIRAIFLNVLRAVPLSAHVFRGVRRVFKAAEALDDAEVFACLAHRFDAVPATYQSRYAYRHVIEEQQSETSRLAWSASTRAYFRRRAWRQLRKLGRLEDAAYVATAAAYLAEVDQDEDAVRIVHPTSYALHKIVHGKSGRMTEGGALTWSLRPSAPLDATGREEPFGHLWDAAPDVVLHLLRVSRSETVRGFAARILGDNPGFCAQIPADVVAGLLAQDSNATYALALAIVRERLSAKPEDVPILVPALMATGKPDAIELAQTVLTLKPELATTNSAFAAGLILAVTPASFDWLDRFWGQHAAAAQVPDLMNEVIEQAVLHPWRDAALEADKERAKLATQLLASHFNPAIQSMQGDLLNVLADAPAVPVKLLAVLLAAERADGIARFNPASMVDHEDPDLQAAGAMLLAKAQPDQLRGNTDLVIAFLRSGSDDARAAAVTAIERLAAMDQSIADDLSLKLSEILFRREQAPGTRDSAVAAAMSEPVLASFVRQGPDRIWKLLSARAEPARRVGAAALQPLQAPDFTLRQIARIGNNDQRVARTWALHAVEARLPEVAAEPHKIFALLDGEWEDSREAAYSLIRDRMDVATWQPETVVALCDCVTVPAQAFGREVLGRAFADDNAQLFLTRLCEHPSAGFRLTIARMIREYAAGDANKLRTVEPALRTILSRVFSSRAAKSQAVAYLREEIARGDPNALPILGDLLDRLSATCAVGDRARLLELIVQLKAKAPDLVPSVKMLTPEDRLQGTA